MLRLLKRLRHSQRKAADMSDTPRVEAVIQKAMGKHPPMGMAATAAYYEAVHQELAPLARELERELVRVARVRSVPPIDVVRVFWQQHTLSDALSMSMPA